MARGIETSLSLLLLAASLIPLGALRHHAEHNLVVGEALSVTARDGHSIVDAVPEPSPNEFFADIASVDFSEQPYAEQMAAEGSLPMTDAQKVFQSEYWDVLMHGAIEKLRSQAEKAGVDASDKLSAIAAVPKLTEAVLYDESTWASDFLPKVQTALDTLKEAKSTAETDMAALLGRLTFQFKLDMSSPRSMFYLGMTDTITVRFSGPPSEVAVPLSSTRVMHSLDQQTARDKTDKRSLTVAKFFERMYDDGLAKAEWSLEDALASHESEEAKAAKEVLSSVTPYLSFELSGAEKGGPAYVFMEGNGRINAMSMAMDKVRLAHPDFVAPSISVQAFGIKDDIEGAELIRKNRNFFLDLNWRTQFPVVDVPGWKHFATDCVRQVTDDFVEKVKSRPRYFGFMPTRDGLYVGP